MARKIMREFRMTEISGVDRPAQKGAVFTFMKRDGGAADVYLAKRADESPLAEHVEAYLKRDFTDDKRKELAGSGAAMPDGSFPIENRADLRNAVRAIGRSKNTAKAKAHIISRARSLGGTASLPEDWNVAKLLKSLTNDEAVAGFQKAVDAFTKDQMDAGVDENDALVKSKEFANALLAEVGECALALKSVADEIEEDPAITEKAEALQDSFSQFMGHLKGIIPEGIENTHVVSALAEVGLGIGGGALVKLEEVMGFDIKKSLGLPATATDADVEKAFQIRDAAVTTAADFLKMSAKHSGFMANDKAKMPSGGKPAFAAMTPAERDAHMASNPCDQSPAEKADALKAAHALIKASKKKGDAEDETDGGDDEDTEKCLKVDGTVIRKADVGDGVFAVLKSQQAAIEKAAETEAVTVFTKRADTGMKWIGKSDEIATLLRSVQKSAGDAVAEAVAKKFEQLNEVIRKGGATLFTEVGSQGHGGNFAKAADEVTTLATKMMAESGGKIKSIYKAKDIVRMGNPELKKREEAEAAEARKAA